MEKNCILFITRRIKRNIVEVLFSGLSQFLGINQLLEEEGTMFRKIRENYLNSLKVLSDSFDSVILIMQNSLAETKITNWFSTLLALPCKDLSKLIKAFQDIRNMNASAIPFIGGIIPIIIMFWLNVQMEVKIMICIGIFLFLYVSILPYYLLKMTSFTSPYFHIGAYRYWRKQEFELFKHSLLAENFSFASLRDFVNATLTKQEDQALAVDKIIQEFNKQKNELVANLEKQERRNELGLREYATLVDHLDNLMSQKEKVLKYLVELVQDINIILYRMKNNRFDENDLRILSGFTIYELKDNNLELIAERGTTGKSPAIISLDDQEYQDWACVAVSKGNMKEAHYNNPYNNYVVVSFRMEMDNNETWIFNLHINERTNEKGLLLTLSNDIIDNKEVFRLIHALCLLLQERGFEKEVVRNVSSK